MAPASFAVRTLIAIAERRKGVDAARCRLVLLHCETAKLLRRCLRSALERNHLTELQFAALVVLFSTEPEPLPASIIAEHAAVSPVSVKDAVDRLESLRLVRRTRDYADRRILYVRITPAGQETVDTAINDYLRAAAGAAREVRPSKQRAVLTAYMQLLRGLTNSARPLRPEATRS